MTKRALVLVALLLAGACDKDADPIWTVSDPSIAKVIAVVGTHAWVSGLKGGVVGVTAMSKNDPNARDAVTLTVTQPAPDVGARPVPTRGEIKLPI